MPVGQAKEKFQFANSISAQPIIEWAYSQTNRDSVLNLDWINI
jgi:hypothetical protein